MLLWFMFALMTAAAIFAVLWPLGQAAMRRPGVISQSIVTNWMKSSVTALPGRIGEAEAQAARVEVSRRLIPRPMRPNSHMPLPIGHGSGVAAE